MLFLKHDVRSVFSIKFGVFDDVMVFERLGVVLDTSWDDSVDI